MRFVTIDRLEKGMLLANAIFDEYGSVLLGPYSELTDEYIRKLAERGFPGAYITDHLSEDIDIEETISMELRSQGIKNLKECNIDALLDVSKKIVEEILNSKSISLDLVDLRTFDDYTYRHSVNVAVLSTIIGMGFHMSGNEMVNLCEAAIFHDLGKTLIDPDILKKPGRLTAEEYEVMKTHSRRSYELIKDRYDISASTKAGVLFHHENIDGSGYPDGMAGDDIHLYARIIHVADVYDALTSKRPYKEPFSLAEAVEYLMGGCNILFDQKVVEVFLDYVPVYPKGMSVILSDGREGIVVENYKRNVFRPKIRLYNGEEINLSEDYQYLNITIQSTVTAESNFSDELSRIPKDRNTARKSVLVVDDMVTNLKTIQSILEQNYKVFLVKSGEQALDFMEKNAPPDLILMDIRMPGMDGIETVHKIYEAYGEDIPVIFLTALSDRETVLRCHELHAQDYILKPFKPVYIQERIRSILGGFADV